MGTALSCAAGSGHIDCVRLLIEAGADKESMSFVRHFILLTYMLFRFDSVESVRCLSCLASMFMEWTRLMSVAIIFTLLRSRYCTVLLFFIFPPQYFEYTLP